MAKKRIVLPQKVFNNTMSNRLYREYLKYARKRNAQEWALATGQERPAVMIDYDTYISNSDRKLENLKHFKSNVLKRHKRRSIIGHKIVKKYVKRHHKK